MSTSPLTQRVIYSDLYTNLDTHPIKGTLLRKTNSEAVKQSIRNLVLTNYGERLFQPNLGGNVRALLFEHATPQAFITAKHTLENLISSHEPRAELIDIVISTTSQDHGVQIQIIFRVINTQEPVQLDIVLERQR